MHKLVEEYLSIKDSAKDTYRLMEDKPIYGSSSLQDLDQVVDELLNELSRDDPSYVKLQMLRADLNQAL